jgi:hypothetical protein
MQEGRKSMSPITDTSVLLGFSARAMHTPRNEAVRSEQLLRPELDWPLSTDTMVWPTVFDVNGSSSTHRASTMGNLWGPLPVLQRDLATRLAPGRWPEGSSWIVAVAWMTTPECPDVNWPDDGTTTRATISPAAVSDSWEFLGYDVSDDCLLSGLTNCLSSAHSEFSCWHQWADKLNDYHLFDELAHAREFARCITRAINTHTPFHPYGLWRVH